MAKKEETKETKTAMTQADNAGNQITQARQDLIADGVLGQDEADEFKLANPDLFFYKVMNQDDQSLNTLRGIVCDRKQRPDGEGYYYVIGLTKPCKLYKGTGEVFEGKPGDFAWMDERWALQSLAGFLPQRANDTDGVSGIVGITEIVAKPLEKIKTKNNRTVWTFQIFARNAAPTPGMPLIAPSAQLVRNVDDEASLPF